VSRLQKQLSVAARALYKGKGIDSVKQVGLEPGPEDSYVGYQQMPINLIT